MNFLGCDPGMSGALAILNRAGEVVDVTKMPETPKDISDYLEKWGPQIKMAVLESVHAMPKQGVSSSFKFGFNVGMLHMALVAHKIPFEIVTPATWQKPLDCVMVGRTGPTDRKNEKKNHTKARIQELFPSVNVTLQTADAIGLAEYIRRRSNVEKS